jgi:tRNA(adenine34) deaminase
MRVSLREAQGAATAGEVPAGAVVADREGAIVSRARNRVIALQDPTAHAEILAIREAARLVGNYRLNGLILVSTLEPCPMCLAAILHARLDGLAYGAREPKWGALGSLLDLSALPGLNHRLRYLQGGVLAGEAQAQIRDFFRERRKPSRLQGEPPEAPAPPGAPAPSRGPAPAPFP